MNIMCEKLSLGYDQKQIIKNLNLDIKSGDYLSILGENGTGKSTLVQGILGLLKPLNGKVLYNGILQKEIGYLPQKKNLNKNFPATVFEIVLSGTLNQKVLPFYNKNDKKNVSDILNLFEIQDLRNKSYSDLSGGQQQKVLLARAFISTSKLLVLDEPTTALDFSSAQKLYKMLKNLNNKGVTVIMISHDVNEAIRYSSHILHLEKENYFYGTVESYKKSKYKDMFLGGHPYDC